MIELHLQRFSRDKMDINTRIEAFAKLGQILSDGINGVPGVYTNKILELTETQHLKNPWFTPTNVRRALEAIARELTIENLQEWTGRYELLKQQGKSCKVAVIMAGNIPLVGFHDFLSVLITGNHIIVKSSSKDPDLIKFIAEVLIDINHDFEEKIIFPEGKISGFDTIIATGSNNSSRYFEYYFGKYHNIIRRNMNSVALLDGTETPEEIVNLGNDVFRYFGLGCRSVSKIYIPDNFEIEGMIKKWESFSDIIYHHKYANNYDYNKSIYLVNKVPFLDSGFLLLKEDKQIVSPISVLYYERYKDISAVKNSISEQKERIQCIVGHGYIPFGKAQQPKLWDYADGIDTIDFLLKINFPSYCNIKK